MAPKLASKEANYDPICPHCEKKMKAVHWRKIHSLSLAEYVYICPNCKKIIGIGVAN